MKSNIELAKQCGIEECDLFGTGDIDRFAALVEQRLIERLLQGVGEPIEARFECEDCNGTGYSGEVIPGNYWQPPEPESCQTCGGGGSIKATAYTSDQLAAAVLKREQELTTEIANLHTVMMAAAVEITEHWDAHCDSEGYGPANLVRRLENGFPEQYGYDAKTMVTMQQRIDELEAQADSARTQGREEMRVACVKVCEALEFDMCYPQPDTDPFYSPKDCAVAIKEVNLPISPAPKEQ